MTPKTSVTDDREKWVSFGSWVREQRKKARLTRAQVCADETLANKQWIHVVQLARIEAGESRTRREVVERLAKIIGFDVIEALDRAGFAPQHESPLSSRVYSKLRRLTQEHQEDIEMMIDGFLQKESHRHNSSFAVDRSLFA